MYYIVKTIKEYGLFLNYLVIIYVHLKVNVPQDDKQSSSYCLYLDYLKIILLFFMTNTWFLCLYVPVLFLQYPHY